MDGITRNLTDLIGRTPLMELARLSARHGLKRPIAAKVEFFNPGRKRERPHSAGND